MITILEKFGKLRRKLNLLFTQALSPLGIGPKQAVLLRYLSTRGESSLADISRATVTDPAAVNRSVAVLIKKGMIQRREHATDQRRWQVSLTRKGKGQAMEVEKIYAATAEKMVEGLLPREKEAFAALLDKMLASFSPNKFFKEGKN